jgi:hypothetical protein
MTPMSVTQVTAKTKPRAPHEPTRSRSTGANRYAFNA